MLPVIALVGRPNVGKSTLFNRLTRSRDALVADFPGLTRDRKYGQAEIDGYHFILVDTGGINGDEEGIDSLMAAQSLQAIEEADVVLLLVDGRTGLNVADEAIAQHLRVHQKKVLLVVNKTDGIDADSAKAEFFALGLGDVYPIAAAHGRGVSALINHALKPLLGEPLIAEESGEEDEKNAEQQLDELINQPIKMAIIGRPNVGKSTLTNRILGEERVVVFDSPGTTRDSIYIPMERDEQDYVIIDTAGVRKRGKVNETVEKFSVIKTLRAIEDANVVLLVIDAREGVSDQDMSLLGFSLNAGRSLVIAVNKWDGLQPHVKDDIKRELDRRLGFVDFARLHFISALHGTGVGHLFESVCEAYQSATQRVSTSLLTKVMQMAQEDHQPPLVRGRRVKLRYAHAGGYNPPLIVIHGNQVTALPNAYKRYLINYYRKSLKIVGTPIKVEFRDSDNPYSGKKNILSPLELRKRKRITRHHKS